MDSKKAVLCKRLSIIYMPVLDNQIRPEYSGLDPYLIRSTSVNPRSIFLSSNQNLR